MDPTPVTTVHARAAAARSRRRAGVGRAPLATLGAALFVAAALLPGAALAAKPSSLPTDPAATPTLPPGQEKKQTPVPVTTPAPATTPTPTLVVVPTVVPTSPPPVPVEGAASAAPSDPAVASPTDSPAPGGNAGSGGGTIGSGGPAGGPGTAAGGPTGDPSSAPSDGSPPPADEGSGGSGPTTAGGSSGGSSFATSALPIAVGGGIVAGLVGGIMLVIAARRRHEPVPDPHPAEPSIPEPVDHERLLAEALGARTGRHAGAMDDGHRPAWLRRLEPAAGRPVFQDPDVDDSI